MRLRLRLLLFNQSIESLLNRKRCRCQPIVFQRPDILLIDAVRVVPKEPYLLQPLDALQVVIENADPQTQVNQAFAISPSGEIDLGPFYGKVNIKGFSVDEAKTQIEKSIKSIIKSPQVSVTVLQTGGLEQIAGEHVISPDGTVNLGTYGQVYVAGMTLDEVRIATEKHLEQHLENPKISVDVFAYNTMVYYIIVEGAGQGEQVVKLPITGNETVMDAIAALGGTASFSNKRDMWIARPAPAHVGCDQILPIKWVEISKGGSTATNYQLLPGDRVYIAADRLVAADSVIAKVISPFERVFGFTFISFTIVASITTISQRIPNGKLLV